jgi:hypothetical protein
MNFSICPESYRTYSSTTMPAMPSVNGAMKSADMKLTRNNVRAVASRHTPTSAPSHVAVSTPARIVKAIAPNSSKQMTIQKINNQCVSGIQIMKLSR